MRSDDTGGCQGRATHFGGGAVAVQRQRSGGRHPIRAALGARRHRARGPFGIPVATPHELVLGEPDVLVDDYLPDNGQGADQRALGALLRHLHDIQAPDADPVAAEGIPAAGLLPRRIVRR